MSFLTSALLGFAFRLIAGENLHNNHHRYPSRANFAHSPGELDPGYGICRALQALGLARIKPHARGELL
jgi:fatty-acid desaturase